ncbi:hypothetical protein MLD38_028375 [Melastoma candidum]|uniref:Uncharacterized protein n=1 Tax=Melastoma candidum TaxID=119954 RepID=A0ACB9N0X3_9MYRT|nr:hypothetical protein MLD38_028375 [Melastoma candidum]
MTVAGGETRKADDVGIIRSSILIFGATGYLGKYIVRASVSLGHPTSAYVRPLSLGDSTTASKKELVQEFESMGVSVIEGDLDDHEKLVLVLRQVDIVISALPVPQHLHQLKIIEAMKHAPNIQRFVPSEFGNEVDRVRRTLPPFEALLENKRKIRRATEAAGIPHTYVAANSFAAYFVDHILHPNETLEQVVVYGHGHAKAVLNYEEDVAFYTVKAASDPRVANRVIIYRPKHNIVSQSDLIEMWEAKTGKTLNRVHISEDEVVQLAKTKPFPENVPAAILHNIFIKGEQMSYQLAEDDLEASSLYPDHPYTSVEKLLDRCLVDPPRPKLASFAS